MQNWNMFWNMNTSFYPSDLQVKVLLAIGAGCGLIQLNELTSDR